MPYPSWLPEWQPSAPLILITAHVGWGAAIVLAAVSLGCGYWALAVFGGYLLAKEGVWDMLIERSNVEDELVDAAWYSVGACLAWLVLVLS